MTFPNPETHKVERLFTRRLVETTEFRQNEYEQEFYDALTHYVEGQSTCLRGEAGYSAAYHTIDRAPVACSMHASDTNHEHADERAAQHQFIPEIIP